jgi:hypothetical protein
MDAFVSLFLVIYVNWFYSTFGSQMKVLPFVASGGKEPQLAIFKHSIMVYFK